MHNADGIQKMAYDPRPIKAIAHEQAYYAIGLNGVTEIVIYQEGGEMGYINFAAVYKGNFLLARVDLKGWIVEYQEEENNADA